MKRFLPKIILVLLLFLAFTVFKSSPTLAISLKNEETVYLPKTETIEGSYLTTGKILIIDGNIDGDLICAGQNITINGKITGDVLCIGQTITINGSVGGNVRAAGQFLDLNGLVSRNVTIAGQKLNLNSTSRVDAEVMFGGQVANLNGIIGKDVLGAGQIVEVNGRIGKNLKLELESLTVTDKALIGGDLNYTSPTKGLITDEKIVKGKINYKQTPKEEVKPLGRLHWQKAFSWKAKISSILFNLLLGLILVWVWPKGLGKLVDLMDKNPGKSFLYGLAAVVIVPFLLLLMAITIIGIPLAVIAGLLFALILALSRLFTAIFIGTKLLARFAPDKKEALGWSMTTGVVLTWIAFSLPFAGPLLMALAVLLGLGGFIYSFRADKHGN